MKTLNIYAHSATEQQRKSMLGQGIPLNFIKDLETGDININEALNNVKKYVYYANSTDFHIADINCALAAVHFVIAKNEGYGDKTLNEIRNDFIREMNLYFNGVNFLEKTNLEKNLMNIVNGNY